MSTDKIWDFGMYLKPWAQEHFVESMNDEVYHAIPAVSSGQLVTILDRDEGIHKLHYSKTSGEERKETPALRFGKMFHKAVLEGEEFLRRYRVMPEFTGFTKDGKPSTQSADVKAKRQAWLLDQPSDAIIVDSFEERDQLSGMMKAVLAHPGAAKLLEGGKREISGFFNHDGFRFRVRFDILNDGTVVDLKSTINAHKEGFQKQIVDNMYYIQAWIYLMAANTILKQPMTKFKFIAVDKAPPYMVGVHEVGESLLTCADLMTRRALGELRAAITSGFWLPEPQLDYTVEAPDWLMKKLETENS
jgi:exodeoxyribonuclease VIII